MNLNQPVAAFRDMVLGWQQRRPGMEIVVRHVKQADLPPDAFPNGRADLSSFLGFSIDLMYQAVQGIITITLIITLLPSSPSSRCATTCRLTPCTEVRRHWPV